MRVLSFQLRRNDIEMSLLVSLALSFACINFRLKWLADNRPFHHFLSPTEAIKRFLAEFHTVGDDGRKSFKYATQLVELAHREQVSLTIEIEDVGKAFYFFFCKLMINRYWLV